MQQPLGRFCLGAIQLRGGEGSALHAFDQVIEEELARLPALTNFARFTIERLLHISAGITGVEEMRSSEQQVVSNQAGQVSRKAGVAQLLPAEIRQRPDTGREHDPLSFGVQRRRNVRMPRVAAQVIKFLHQLDQKSISLLPGPIPGGQFRVYRILGSLRVPADG